MAADFGLRDVAAQYAASELVQCPVLKQHALVGLEPDTAKPAPELKVGCRIQRVAGKPYDVADTALPSVSDPRNIGSRAAPRELNAIGYRLGHTIYIGLIQRVNSYGAKGTSNQARSYGGAAP